MCSHCFLFTLNVKVNNSMSVLVFLVIYASRIIKSQRSNTSIACYHLYLKVLFHSILDMFENTLLDHYTWNCILMYTCNNVNALLVHIWSVQFSIFSIQSANLANLQIGQANLTIGRSVSRFAIALNNLPII